MDWDWVEEKRQRMDDFGREEDESLGEKNVKGKNEFGLRWRSFVVTIFNEAK